MNMRIGVLGANGQVGLAVCKEIASRSDVQGIAIVRNGLAAGVVQVLVGDDIEIRVGSLSPSTGQRLVGDCDAIINCAFPAASGAAAGRQANERLFAAIKQAAPQAHLTHLSSVAVYGPGSVEATHPKPSSSYGTEKVHHERVLRGLFGADQLLMVRLGHVYGADTPVTGFILDRVTDPHFRLPVPDDAASNAVAMLRAGRALLAAAASKTIGSYDLVDEPSTRWRTLFDWHCDAFGMPKVMTGNGAGPTRPSLPATVAAALRSSVRVPDPGVLAANPIIRGAFDSVVTGVPADFEQAARRWYQRQAVGRQLTRIGSPPTEVPDWIFYPKSPGHNLPATPVDLFEQRSGIFEWYRRVTDPRWIWQQR